MNEQIAQRLNILSKAGRILYFEDLQDDGPIDVDCNDETIQRFLNITTRTWEELGRLEPHWSVLTNPKYSAAEMSETLEAEFYTTGAMEIEAWTRALARNDRRLTTTGTFLEFGCGLGRTTEHISKLVGEYVGVDVSGPHLLRAKARATTQKLRNVEFLTLDTFLKSRGCFDRIASYLVLQHNPPPVIFWLLTNLLQRLAKGGCAIIQIPTRMFGGYVFDVETYLREAETRASPGPMEMHALPQRYVNRAAAAAKCIVLECFPDGRIGPDGFSQTFIFERL